MKKTLCWPFLILAACLIAGAYGAIHNQISYTVSPDYFHAFKFRQFAIQPEFQNRLGASIVGWHASWWMGPIIGVPLATLALIIPGVRGYVTAFFAACAVAAGTALAVGLAALLCAFPTITGGTATDRWVPPGTLDRTAFVRAGTMHNFTYAGGLLGILTGSAYVAVSRIRFSRRPGFGERAR